MTQQVAFFGGSFDPPHIGHVLAASYALSVGFEYVVVAVVKSHAFGKQLSAFEQRLAMAELAFAPLNGVIVSDVEAHLPAPNYTLHTLQHLQTQHPDWNLRLLAGADVLPEFEKWYRFDEVKRLAPPFVLGRSGYALSHNIARSSKGAVPADNSASVSIAANAVALPQVSSTEARRELAACRVTGEPSEWLKLHVPERVLDYAHQQGLYTPETGA